MGDLKALHRIMAADQGLDPLIAQLASDGVGFTVEDRGELRMVVRAHGPSDVGRFTVWFDVVRDQCKSCEHAPDAFPVWSVTGYDWSNPGEPFEFLAVDTVPTDVVVNIVRNARLVVGF